MASLSTSLCLHSASSHLSPSPSDLPPSLSGFRSLRVKDNRDGLLYSRCSATSKHDAQAYKEVTKQDAITKWQEFTKQDIENGEVHDINKLAKWIEDIKAMLSSMEDGEISISAYDTAWVALVENIYGFGGPQFPTSVEWIVNNQLDDGSWGDEPIFSAHDRILNTLGCVIALKTWKIHPEKYEKGLCYIRQNMNKLEDESIEHMPIGFEMVFPSLIEMALKLGLDIPYDSAAVLAIYAQKDIKLTKIPIEAAHKVPTTVLHSLEGMEGLDWEKLIKLQNSDGSFLFSPASTAFALMNTKDEKCFQYLNKQVEKFNGGVPNVYPVDLFERLWTVDRLQRLGVSRYFESEIKDCIDYVAKYWTKFGIAWARNSNVYDIDDTAMGFRLLRLHGYNVSPDVFRNFQKGKEFVCFVGQSNQAITGIYNLYRAAQLSFPGETILEDCKKFAYKFLCEKQASKQLLDKWIITKDLPGEVGYALNYPWTASLPRIETRLYLEQYGGENDVWIGKTLYRMSCVNNDKYLDVAKLDFNNCQEFHQIEWDNIQKWYLECNLGKFGVTDTKLLRTYFVATSSIFEPERLSGRLAWTKIALLLEAISSHFKDQTEEQRKAFVIDFIDNKLISRSSNYSNGKASNLVHILVGTLNEISITNGRGIQKALLDTFENWLITWENSFSSKEVAGLLANIINICGGHEVTDEVLLNPQYRRLGTLTNTICFQLGQARKVKAKRAQVNGLAIPTVELDTQELVQIVVRNENGIDNKIKQTFLTVVKSFYYTSQCPQEAMDHHIADVLFKRVA
uniref:Ent-copalyl diphosphate synthase n=1 Tax=Aconitum carmichaelii TaxID=85363 RepID=A0A8E8TXV6_ACOCM|nr:ent-copalyl diphosphate synthase [Aconitum carmichaelii]